MSENPFLWYHSQDEECMSQLHDKPMTYADALAELLALGDYEPGDVVYLVEANRARVGKLDAARIFEDWIECNEECWGDDWPEPTGEDVQSLQCVLDQWMADNPGRLPVPWSFGTMHRHTITIPLTTGEIHPTDHDESAS